MPRKTENQPFQNPSDKSGIYINRTPQDMKLPDKRQSPTPPAIYPGETVARIVNCVADDIRPAIILVASNLFRMTEARRMTYEQLFKHWDAGWIWIPDNAAFRTKCRCLSRWVPINPATRHLLAPYIKKRGLLYPRNKTHDAFAVRYQRELNRMGIPHTRECLRKSCISAHFAFGVDKRHICKWSGLSESAFSADFVNHPNAREEAVAWAAGMLGTGEESPDIEGFLTFMRKLPVRRPGYF